MTPEKALTLAQLREKLGKVLPSVPTSRTLYRWMELSGMPYSQMTSRNRRTFKFSQVLRWLETFDHNQPKGKAS